MFLLLLAPGFHSLAQSMTGTKCFQKKTYTVDDIITISSDDGINFHGTKNGTHVNDELGIYDYWVSEFTAQIKGNILVANISMEFEGQIENYEEEWELYLCNDAQFIIVSNDLYRLISCPDNQEK